MKNSLEKQARSFHKVLSAFVKKYQLRNRNAICCGEVTVSQCYVMEALAEHQVLSMHALARYMQLSVSTMTRTVDQIIGKGYAVRYQDAQDRRRWYVTLTEKGKATVKEMENRFIAQEIKLLSAMSASEREHVIRLLESLSGAIDTMQSCTGHRKG